MSGRTLTGAIDTELGQSTTAPRWLAKLEFDSGDVRLWNGLGDLTFAGEVYTGAGRLVNIEAIQETQETVASGVRMSLSIQPTTDQPDAADAILNIALGEEYQGRPVTIWQAQMALWTPVRLFDAGEAGVWYDPSDPSTVWQDSARTIPALVDDPVGAIDDKSGNGNHALQATAANRPMLRQTAGGKWYLEGDGDNDFLRAAFAYSQPMDRISAIRLITRPASAQIFGGVTANAGVAFTNDNSLIQIFSGVILTRSGFALDNDFVVTELHSGANSKLTLNNTSYATGDGGTDLGGGVTILARNTDSANANARCYGMVMGSFSGLTDTQIQKARIFMAARAGITVIPGSLGLELLGDPFIRFKGRMDVMEDSEFPGSAVIAITAENRLVDLGRSRRRTYTPEDQKASHSGDTFFDEVAALQLREIAKL